MTLAILRAPGGEKLFALSTFRDDLKGCCELTWTKQKRLYLRPRTPALTNAEQGGCAGGGRADPAEGERIRDPSRGADASPVQCQLSAAGAGSCPTPPSHPGSTPGEGLGSGLGTGPVPQGRAATAADPLPPTAGSQLHPVLPALA